MDKISRFLRIESYRITPLAMTALAVVFALVLTLGLAVPTRAQVCSGASGGSGGSGGATLKTITIGDGSGADWATILANPLQNIKDGEFTPQCNVSPIDKDCTTNTTITGRDLDTFSWTFDNTYIYLYQTRYGSSTNTQTFYFYMDTSGDQKMQTGEKVLKVELSGSNQRTDSYICTYNAKDTNGDPMACPSGPCNSVSSRPLSQTGYADGYIIVGTLSNEVFLETWQDPLPGGFDDGTGFEARISWSTLGVPYGTPIFYHVASANLGNINKVPEQLDDNLGGPSGGVGSFAFHWVSISPDRTSTVTPASPTVVEYVHTVRNTGTFMDRFDFSGVSSLGCKLELYDHNGGAGHGTLMGTDNNGDGTWESVNSGAGYDGNANGKPDTPLLARNGTFLVRLKITFPTGALDVQDITKLRAIVYYDNAAACADALVTDTTAVGDVTLQPTPQSKSVMPGSTVDYSLTLTNYSIGDTFDLRVNSSLGYRVDLYDGATLVATDLTGDGTWDTIEPGYNTNGNLYPDFYLINGASKVFTVRITGGATVDAVDTTTVLAQGAAYGASASATLTTTVRNRLTLTPNYLVSNGTNLFSGDSRSVFFAHALINSWTADDTITLGAVPSPAWTYRFWTDPNGDGNPADGALITSAQSLAANGGTLYFVVELVIPNITSGFPVTNSMTVTATSGLAPTYSVSVTDEVVVSYLASFEDAARTISRATFARCQTIFVLGSSLTPGTTTQYRIDYVNPGGTVVRSQTVPTNGNGEAYDQYIFPSAATLGVWHIRLYSSGTQIDDIIVNLDPPPANPSTISPLGTTRASYAITPTSVSLSLTATFNNSSSVADYEGTTFRYLVLTPTGVSPVQYLTSAGTWANYTLSTQFTRTTGDHTVPHASSVTETVTVDPVTFPAAGIYRLEASWVGSCDNIIATASTTFPVGTTLASYADAGLTQPSDLFGSGSTVYLAGANYLPSTSYKVAYYDASGLLTLTQTVSSTAGGALSTSVGASALGSSGTWHAVAYRADISPPPFYNDNDARATSQDSFVIQEPAPVVTGPINANPPSITGTSTSPPGTTITLYSNGIALGTTTVQAGGTWTYSGSGLSGLVGGESITATAGTGVSQSPVSNTVVVTPAAPVINGPLVEGQTSITGTGVPGATVTVTIGGVDYTATVQGDGTWSVSVPPLVAPGTVSATQTIGGQTSGSTFAPVHFLPPVVTGPIYAGASSISGTSPSPDGTVITVYNNGAPIGTAVVSGGTWTLTGVSGLVGGESITAVAGVGTAAESAVSNTVIVTPAAPVITTPLVEGDTSVGGTSTAPPGSTITVTVGGIPYTTTVQAGGTWTVTVPPLAGDTPVSATVTTNGQTSPPASTTVHFLPPVVSSPINAGDTSISGTSPSPAGTTITVYQDGLPIGTTTVQAGGTWTLTGVSGLVGGESITATAGTGAALSAVSNTVIVTPAAPVITTPLVEGDTSVGGTSTAPPGSTITVTVGGIPYTTTVQVGGTWTVTVPPLAGDTPVSVTVTTNGQTSPPASATVHFLPPVVSSPINAGDTSISGTSPSPAGTTITVYQDGLPIGTTTVQAGGTWTLTGVSGLVGGESITATAGTGAAESAVSNTVIVTPAAPVITTPLVEGDTSVGGTSTAPPGSTITVTVGGIPYTTTVQAGGTWTVTVPPLAGDTPVSVTVTTNGQTSPPASATVLFLPPVVSSPIYAGATSVSGTSPSPAGTTITVYQDGSPIGTTTVQAGGTWTLTGVSGLVGGESITATAGTGAAESAVSNTVVVQANPSLPPIVSSPLYAGTGVTIYGSSVEAPGSVITVYINGVPQATHPVVQPDGTWSLPGQSLAEGNEITATVLAAGKTASGLSNEVIVSADSSDVTPPPVITAPVPTGSTSVSGTCVPGATIDLYADGVYLGTISDGDDGLVDGHWTLGGLAPLADGTILNATATLSPTGTSAWSAPVLVRGSAVHLLRSDKMTLLSDNATRVSCFDRPWAPEVTSLDPLGDKHFARDGEKGPLTEPPRQEYYDQPEAIDTAAYDGDKTYKLFVPNNWLDTDTTVLTDNGRPLIFYELFDNNANTLYLTKESGTIKFTWVQN